MSEWTPHDGGAIQAPTGAWVDVIHRDGSVSLRREVPPRHSGAWKHLGTECDIVGWRPATPPPGVLASDKTKGGSDA